MKKLLALAFACLLIASPVFAVQVPELNIEAFCDNAVAGDRSGKNPEQFKKQCIRNQRAPRCHLERAVDPENRMLLCFEKTTSIYNPGSYSLLEQCVLKGNFRTR